MSRARRLLLLRGVAPNLRRPTVHWPLFATVESGKSGLPEQIKPVVELIKKTLKVYPYEAGAFGTSIAQFLNGDAKLGRITPPPPTVFHEGSGVAVNTITPNDYSYYR